MRVESPIALIISLFVVTLLGIVIGYCLGLLRSKRRARQAILLVQKIIRAKQQTILGMDLTSAKSLIGEQRQMLVMEREKLKRALKRESALGLHAQLQAQRIQTLESQVSSYEDQQIRLKRDFASYKSNKARELELAKSTPSAWSKAGELPVLQKRIIEPAAKRKKQASLYPFNTPEQQRELERRTRQGSARGLSTSLSRELEIPALAETELPDSVEDLDFELLELDAGGALPRG